MAQNRPSWVPVAKALAAAAVIAGVAAAAPAVAAADGRTVEEFPLGGHGPAGSDAAGPGAAVGSDVAAPVAGDRRREVEALRALLPPADALPRGFDVSDVVGEAAAATLRDIEGVVAHGQVLPLHCDPGAAALDPDAAAVRLAAKREAGVAVVLTAARAHTATLAAEADRLADCEYATSASESRFTEVRTRIQPPPVTAAEDEIAFTRTVVFGDGASVSTLHMATFVGIVNGARVSASIVGTHGYTPDMAMLDAVFVRAVEAAANG